ncbi:MAG: N-acetylmuramoyl-L-alanine amidase family protein [Clostridium sp.]|nr:N-acetylmuramoyl-L-alanine amidase family protein [Clostridium sp.]
MFGHRIRGLWLSVAVALLTLGNAALTYGDTAIPVVKVNFQDQYEESGMELLEPVVSAGTEGYTVETITWSSSSAEWKPGETVTASIRLKPEEGYEFSYYYDREKIEVSGAKFLTYWKEPSGRLFIKASYIPVVQLGQTSHAGWSTSSGTRAVWEAVPYATAYQLKLYHGDGDYVTTLTLRGTSVELEAYLLGADSYYYEVRATSKNSEDAAVRKNGAYVASDGAVTGEAEVKGSWLQTGEERRYIDETGSPAADGWRYLQGIWYYFDRDGCAATGWRQLNGTWYYMDAQGRMQTGWLKLEDKTYYLDSTGAMAVGWYQMSPGVWYYFYEDGSMAKETEIDGYVLGSNGMMR